LQVWALRNQPVASTNLDALQRQELHFSVPRERPVKSKGTTRAGKMLAWVSRSARHRQRLETVRKIQAAEPAARQLPRAAGVGSLKILASMSLSRPVRDVATERGAN
jgi:hypothetical protein